MGKSEARALSDALFRRLAELAPESHAYSYVRGTIIELNMALVRFVASRYRYRPQDLEDILQVGTIGLIKAVDGYDCERGIEFSTYAIPTISGEIKRFFRDTSWRVRVPRSMQELHCAVVRGGDRLEQDLGRPPCPQELAEALDLTLDEVATGLLAGRLYRSTSLDALREGDDQESGSAMLDRIGEVDERLDLVVFREAVRPLLGELTRREQTILLLRFWGGRTQSEIAERIGVSQMQVSRLLTSILGALRERLEDGDNVR